MLLARGQATGRTVRKSGQALQQYQRGMMIQRAVPGLASHRYISRIACANARGGGELAVSLSRWLATSCKECAVSGMHGRGDKLEALPFRSTRSWRKVNEMLLVSLPCGKATLGERGLADEVESRIIVG